MKYVLLYILTCTISTEINSSTHRLFHNQQDTDELVTIDLKHQKNTRSHTPVVIEERKSRSWLAALWCCSKPQKIKKLKEAGSLSNLWE